MSVLISQRRAIVLGALSHGPVSVRQLAHIADCDEAQVRATIAGLRYHNHMVENIGPFTFRLVGPVVG